MQVSLSDVESIRDPKSSSKATCCCKTKVGGNCPNKGKYQIGPNIALCGRHFLKEGIAGNNLQIADKFAELYKSFKKSTGDERRHNLCTQLQAFWIVHAEEKIDGIVTGLEGARGLDIYPNIGFIRKYFAALKKKMDECKYDEDEDNNSDVDDLADKVGQSQLMEDGDSDVNFSDVEG